MNEGNYREIAKKLYKKYGLRKLPTDADVESWYRNVRILKLRSKDEDLRILAREAAQKVFGRIMSIKSASQSDTIETLLEEIRRKQEGK